MSFAEGKIFKYSIQLFYGTRHWDGPGCFNEILAQMKAIYYTNDYLCTSEERNSHYFLFRIQTARLEENTVR